jgi:O-antigen/teichoic acid export membrane protein
VSRRESGGLSKAIAGTTATKFALIPVALVTSVVVTRSLGPSEKGEYSLVFTYLNIVNMVAGFGVGRAALYILTRQREVDGAAVKARTMQFALWSGLGLSATALAGAALLGSSVLEGTSLALVLVGLPLVLTSSLRTAVDAFLRADERVGWLNALTFLASGLVLLLVVGFAIAPVGLSPAGVITARSIAAAAALLLAGYLATRLPGGLSWKVASSYPRTGDILRLGLSYTFVSLAQNVNYDVDILLLGLYESDASVGYYSTAVTVAEMLWLLPMAAGWVLVARSALQGDDEAARQVSTTMRIALVVGVCGGLILLIVSPLVVGVLFGSAFQPSVGLVRLLVPGVLAATTYQVLSAYLLGRGAMRSLIVATCGGAILNIALNVALIPRLGAAGAAIASNISYLLTGAVVLAAYVSATGQPLRDVLLVRASDLREAGRMVASWVQPLAERVRPGRRR